VTAHPQDRRRRTSFSRSSRRGHDVPGGDTLNQGAQFFWSGAVSPDAERARGPWASRPSALLRIPAPADGIGRRRGARPGCQRGADRGARRVPARRPRRPRGARRSGLRAGRRPFGPLPPTCGAYGTQHPAGIDLTVHRAERRHADGTRGQQEHAAAAIAHLEPLDRGRSPAGEYVGYERVDGAFDLASRRRSGRGRIGWCSSSSTCSST